MKSRNFLLTTLMTLLVIGLQAQTNDLQTLKEHVDQIVKSKDAKDQKQDKLFKALKSYGDELTRKKPGKQGEELISRQELDDLLGILRPASIEIEKEGASGQQPKSRGVTDTWTLEQCLIWDCLSDASPMCLQVPHPYNMPGVCIIIPPTIGLCAPWGYYGDFCSNLQ
jgi:hypothetical protein